MNSPASLGLQVPLPVTTAAQLPCWEVLCTCLVGLPQVLLCLCLFPHLEMEVGQSQAPVQQRANARHSLAVLSPCHKPSVIPVFQRGSDTQ